MRLGALAAGLFGAAAGAGLAEDQAGAPLPLFPMTGEAPAEAAPATPEAAAPKGIVVQSLATVDPEAFGILGAAGDPWAADGGARLWGGTPLDTALARVKGLPVASPSPAVRGMVRLLLESASAPIVPAPPRPGAWTAARAEALVAAGLAEDARALLALAPRSAQNEATDLAFARAAWQAGDSASACTRAEENLQHYDSPVWTRMSAVCAFLKGDAETARMKFNLLEDQGQAGESFHVVMSRVLGGGRMSLPALPEGISEFEIAALARAKVRLPEDLPVAVSPWLLRMTLPEDGPVSDGVLLRLEDGLRRGLVKADAAEGILGRLKAADSELAQVRAFKTGAEGPRGRALYWRALQATQVPAARAEVISRLFAAARKEPGAWAAWAVVLHDSLVALADQPAAAWLAGDAARALLWTGDWHAAARWADLAKQNAGSSEAAKATAEALRPLLAFVTAPALASARADVLVPVGAALADPAVRPLRDRVLALARAFGFALRESDWHAALADPALPATDAVSPSPVLAAAVTDAAHQSKPGETLALAARMLGTGGDLGRLDPGAVGTAVRALLAADAPEWARRIAVESLIAAGY